MFNFFSNLFQNPAGETWLVNHCFSCLKKIRDGVVFPEDHVSFCNDCFHTTACFCCGLPCGPVHRRLSDDRIVCVHCYKSALLAPRQLAPVYETTLKFFRKKLKMKLKDQPRLKVVDTRFMQKTFNCSPYTWGIYANIEAEETIYIISGIALDKSHTTLAHELTHFWQKRNCPRDQTLELIEGFAEWVAYQLAQDQKLKRAMLGIRRNGEEPYRTGFEKMCRLETRLGVKGVIKYVKTHKRF